MKRVVIVLCSAILRAAIGHAESSVETTKPSTDQSWPSFGGQADEQRFSVLTQIDAHNVDTLGLAWYQDLPVGASTSAPVAAEGKVFTATGYTLVSAFDAANGKLLWRHDSKAAVRSGSLKLRNGWGIRGLSYMDGRIFVATHDGRLLCLDAGSGKLVWSVLTTEPGDNRFITGAPRAFVGKVLIGHGGGDGAGARGYVTCYEAKTGRRLWRFYTVPGNPAKGFENDAMKTAAGTWHGEWWKYGGGGVAWNGLTYDSEFNRFYIGVGNGFPYNQELRSEGKGDNLFLASVVAVDADTGRYLWHYQMNPGEQWDYDAALEMTLATLEIDGAGRKVLMQASKNGFFYVIDRTTGKLISAVPFADKVTWAAKIDLETGRPVENPGARYHGKDLFELWPGSRGAHSWLPQSFSPKTGLVYIPVFESGTIIGDKGLDLENFPGPVHTSGGWGVTGDFSPDLPGSHRSFLKAWDPVTQKARWQTELPGDWPAGTLATAGNLVFQGRIDRQFDAYTADTGKLLWSFDTRSPITAPPITFSVNARQYVTVLTGSGNSGGGFFAKGVARFGMEYYTMPRRVLTFALNGSAMLPPAPPLPRWVAPVDPDLHPDAALTGRGNLLYHLNCAPCHGAGAVAGGAAPDLRMSVNILHQEGLRSIVKGGVLVPDGMPQFAELSDADLEAIRLFLRVAAHALPQQEPSAQQR